MPIELTTDTILIIANIVIILVGGTVAFILTRRKRKRAKLMQGQDTVETMPMAEEIPKGKKQQVIGTVPVKIIKKRGDTLLIQNTKGTIKKADPQGELKILFISKDQQLDKFDFTKINREGEVILMEGSDGQLSYADIDKDKVTSSGEGMLRDGYYLNQRFVDEAFPINKDSWAKWVPLIVVFFAIIGIGISSYLTYNYYKELNKGYSDMSEANAEAITQATQSMERIARSLEIATENQKGIEQAYRELIAELKGVT